MADVDKKIAPLLLDFFLTIIRKLLQIAIERKLRCSTSTVQGSTILCLRASENVQASISCLTILTAIPDWINLPSMEAGYVVAAVAD